MEQGLGESIIKPLRIRCWRMACLKNREQVIRKVHHQGIGVVSAGHRPWVESICVRT